MRPSPVAARGVTLRTSGAQLYVESRGQGPAVMLVGCPMSAYEFAPLADVLARGCTVITMDPRGIGRSHVDDRNLDVTPEVLAEDMSSVLAAFATGPAAVFGSSGGAVAALALVLTHPEQVHTVVAHEPPLEELLGDRERLRANTEAIVQTYLTGDVAGAWRMFFAGADITVPDEAALGSVPVEQDPKAMADEAFFFAHTLRPSTWWQPDLDALRHSSARIVIGIGEGSIGQVCYRTSTALASALGRAPTMFPGDHVGFVAHPEHFADRLRAVPGLDSRSSGATPGTSTAPPPAMTTTRIATAPNDRPRKAL